MAKKQRERRRGKKEKFKREILVLHEEGDERDAQT